MPRPYSNDLRERVVAVVESGQTCREAAARFDIAVSSVVKWSQRHRTTGSVAPSKMGGYRRPVLDPHRDFIVERIRQTSHLTLHGLKDELAARGVKVSHDTVWRFLRREGLSFKKKHCSLLSRRAPMSPAAGGAGRRGSRTSILIASSSSTRPGSRPIWRPCAAGDRGGSDCVALLPTAAGAP